VQLSAMVAEHVASLSPLPPHAPPQAMWDGQLVPPPPQYWLSAKPPQHVPHSTSTWSPETKKTAEIGIRF
jgi:hypothetical protein